MANKAKKAISKFKKPFIRNVENCVAEHISIGNPSFTSFQSFKEYLALELGVGERMVNNYFDDNHPTMPTVDQLNIICDILGIDSIDDLLDFNKSKYDPANESKRFIQNIIYFLDSNEISIAEANKNSVNILIQDKIISNIVTMFIASKELDVDISKIANEVIKKVSDSLYYFKGKYYDEEFVKQQYIFFTAPTDEQEQLLKESESSEEQSAYYGLIDIRKQQWSDMDRDEKIQFWSRYCIDRLSE